MSFYMERALAVKEKNEEELDNRITAITYRTQCMLQDWICPWD